MRMILLAAVTGAIFSTTACAQDVKVAITSPVDGSSVGQRPIVQGTAGDAAGSVWVIVHPLGVSDYWVQPRVTARDKGSWKVQIHIGRPGSVDVDKVFEVRAVVKPHIDLREGKVLDGWPDAKAISNVIELTRE